MGWKEYVDDRIALVVYGLTQVWVKNAGNMERAHVVAVSRERAHELMCEVELVVPFYYGEGIEVLDREVGTMMDLGSGSLIRYVETREGA